MDLNTFTFEGLENVFGFWLNVHSLRYLIMEIRLERVFYGGNMCKYCEKLNSIISLDVNFEVGDGIESSTNGSVFGHIAKHKESDKFFFSIDEDYSAYFEIEYCPKCGRDLSQ